jgi:DNA-binding response OmpR family regulator
LVKAQHAQPQLILLDVMLPGLSGFDVLKNLRGSGVTTPVLMLTAKGAELDKVQAFALGTDDYVTKPFSSLELLGRIEALLRRCARAPQIKPTRLQWGAFTIDVDRMELLNGGLLVDVPPRAVELFGVLACAGGAVVSRETLCESLWGHGGGSTRTIDNLVVKLRKAIEVDAEQPRVLLTVHGRGYRLESCP